MCRFCLKNQSTNIIGKFARIPVFGVPFSITKTVLECGRAVTTGDDADIKSAIIVTLTTVVDVVSAVLIISGLDVITAEVLKETGVKLSLKLVLDILASEEVSIALKEVNDTQEIALLIKTALCPFAIVQASNEKNPGDRVLTLARASLSLIRWVSASMQGKTR
jgi:hypothetical protein